MEAPPYAIPHQSGGEKSNSPSKKLQLLSQSAVFFLLLCAFLVPISITATTITYLIAVLLALLWSIKAHHSITQYLHPVVLCFLIIWCTFIVFSFHSVAHSNQIFSFIHKQHIFLLTPLLFFVIRSDRQRERIINAFVIAMALTTIIATLKTIGWDPLLSLFHFHKPKANVFFFHIVQSFFMSIAFLIESCRLFILRHQKYYFLRVLFLILMASHILLFSDSRTGYLCISIAVFYLSFLKFRWRGLVLMCTTMGVLFACSFMLSSQFHTRMREVVTQAQDFHRGHTHTSVGIRMGMWNNGWRLIEQFPLVGVGTAGIPNAVHNHLTPAQIKESGSIIFTECSIINFWLQFGIWGVIVFVGFFYCLWYYSGALDRFYQTILRGFLLLFLSGSLINAFVMSFPIMHLFSLLIAVLMSPVINREHIEKINY